MAYNPKDFYFRKAKERHFAARSVFKLEEIDGRFRIFRPGDKVLDLGCAPGSWSQYASGKIGPRGICVGIDLARTNVALPNARFHQGDAFEEATLSRIAAEEGLGGEGARFDVVMSDMAPKTSGIRIQDQERSFELCKRALEVAKSRLRKGGNFVVKIFQSGAFEEFLKLARPSFERIELLRPKSTRKASYEIYVVGLGKRS